MLRTPLLTLLASTTIATVFVATPASAGFQWTAPVDQAVSAQPQQSPVETVPSIPTQSQQIIRQAPATSSVTTPQINAPVPQSSVTAPQASTQTTMTPDIQFGEPISLAPTPQQGPAQVQQQPQPVVQQQPMAMPQQQAQPAYTSSQAMPPIPWPNQSNNSIIVSQQPPVQEPVMITNKAPQQQQPQIQPINAPQPIIDSSYMQEPLTPVTPAINPNPANTGNMTTANYTNFDLAVGFGDNIPLVMAVKQIVPEAYGLAFDEAVPMEHTVSWQGGQPWDQVLGNVLNPLGFKASIQGNMIMVSPIAKTTMGMNNPATNQRPQMIDIAHQVQMAPTQTGMQSTTPEPTMAVENAIMTSEPASGRGYAEPISLMAPRIEPVAPSANNTMAQNVVYGSNIEMATFWSGSAGMTLREVLQDWSTQANVDLYWASEYDYPINSDVNIQGNFEDAVMMLLKGLEEANPKPSGRLHPNYPNGPAVLVIETKQIID